MGAAVDRSDFRTAWLPVFFAWRGDWTQHTRCPPPPGAVKGALNLACVCLPKSVHIAG